MLRVMSTLVLVTAMLGFAAPATAHDCKGCQAIGKKGDGFCAHCGKGKVFGVDLTSQKLYDATAGKEVQIDEMKCAGCKKAAATNGSCCGKSFAHGKAYHSPVGYTLAKGKPYTEAKAGHCPGCRDAFASHGFCTGCNVGFVAHRLYKDKESHDAALAAHQTLVKAAEISKKCEACAVAMVTNGKCDHCNVSFKDGKPVKE
jgi:hypothetical protein